MDDTTSTTAPEQLALLAPPPLPLQFLLDQRTRQRGMAHVAAIKAQLAERALAQQPRDEATVPGRRKAA